MVKNTKIKNLLEPHKKFRAWKRGHLILFLIGLFLIVILVVYFSVAWYQGYKFRQVEKKMDKLQNAFIDVLGKPLYQTNNESCGYASREFGRGPLSCSFDKSIYYYGTNDKLINITKKAQDLVNKQIGLFSVSYEQKPKANWSSQTSGFDTPGQTIEVSYKPAKCDIVYSLYKDAHLPVRVTRSSTNNFLQISAECITYPWRPIFNTND